MAYVKKQFEISGMTCTSCQNRIENKLKGTAGIIDVSVSYEKNEVRIVFDADTISFEAIVVVIENLGYEYVANTGKSRVTQPLMLQTLATIVLLYIGLQKMGILNYLVPSQLADGKMGYSMLFMMGLITSIHCMAMCGGINLSQCLPKPALSIVVEDKKISHLSPFAASFLYNGGRVVSYTLIGLILGWVGAHLGTGQTVGLSAYLQGVLKIIAGIAMTSMGINMLGIFPLLRKFQNGLAKYLKLPMPSSHKVSSRPFIVGLLNGFMPCGPLQAMQIIALASGSPIVGALSMLVFSLGTVPLMLGLGAFISSLGNRHKNQVMRVGSILVVVLGLALLTQGGSLSGLFSPNFIIALLLGLSFMVFMIDVLRRAAHNGNSMKWFGLAVVGLALIFWRGAQTQVPETPLGSSGISSEVIDDIQVIETTLTAGSYPDLVLKVGVPVKWTMNAPEGSINGCNYKMNIPEFGLNNYGFKTGNNLIEFTPNKVGTYHYSCWMGMINGTITVVNEDLEADGSRVEENPIQINGAVSEVKGDVQYVTSRIVDGGYEPISVKAGIPVKWTLIAPKNSLNGCNNAIVVPEYDLNFNLKEGKNEVEFVPKRSGTFVFSCWMGMIQSDIIVMNPDGTVDPIGDSGSAVLPSCCGN